MYSVQLLLLVILIFIHRRTYAENLEQDVVKTAKVAFHEAMDPAIVCRTYEEKCVAILRALQDAGLVLSNWSLKGFRQSLNTLKRETVLKYDAIVLIVQNLEYLAGVLHKMTLLHSRARYIIVEIGEEERKEGCCRGSGLPLFDKLWSKKRLHRLVLLRLACPGFALTVDFFKNNGNGCMRQISTDDVPQLSDVFTRHIRNMNGRVLRISMSPAQDLRRIDNIDGIPYEGVDATILREYVRYLNFTVDVRRATNDRPYAFTFPNGTMVGSAVDLTTGKSDIVFNGNFMYYLGSTPAQISTWYQEDALCVVTKKAGRVPKLVALFTPFSQPFLWAVFAMVALVSCVLFMIRFVAKSFYKKNVNLFDSLAIVASFMAESPTAYKKRITSSERLLLASCSLWAIVVLGTYQGTLRGSLTIPKDLKDIDTLEELDKSGYNVYVNSENLLTVFQSPDNPIMESLVKKTILVNDTLRVLQKGDPRVATLTRKESAYRRVQPDEHVINECVRRSQLSFMVRVGSPATWGLNRLLERFCEAGIIQFLRVTERREKEIRDKRLQQPADPGQFTLADVQGAFVILAVGSLINTIVFGFELLEGRTKSKLVPALDCIQRKQNICVYTNK